MTARFATFTLALLAAGPALAQAFEVTTGNTTYSSIYNDSGAVKLWNAATDGYARNKETQIALPFAFSFYGQSHQSAVVSTNGYLTFDGASAGSCTGCGTNRSMGASAATPNNLIAPLWDNLMVISYSSTYADAKIYTLTSGTAPSRIFTVEWRRMGIHNTSTQCYDPSHIPGQTYGCAYSYATAKVELYEGTNKIRFIYGSGKNYGPLNYTGSNYGAFTWSAGVEGPGGAEGQNVPFPGGICSGPESCYYADIVGGFYADFTPALDLAAVSVSGPGSIRTGDAITLRKTIANMGSSSAPARDFKIVLSADSAITSADAEIYAGQIPALGAGQSNSDPVTFELGYPGPAGTFFYGLLLAPGDAGAANDAVAGNQTVVAVPLAIVSSATRPDAVEDAFYTDTLTAVGPGTTRTWSVSSGSLPSGLALDTGTGTVSGVPGAPGVSTFTITVSNGSETAAKQFTLTVRPRLRISSTSLPDAVLGLSYKQTVAAVGGPDGRTWSLTFGALPAGLALGTADGVIQGTPTATGASTFTVKVSAGGQSDSRTLEIETWPRLVVALPGNAASPPDAITGTAYSLAPNISGGDGTRTCSISSGALPTGLQLNATTCAIGGTIASPGSWTFAYKVESGNQAVENSWTIAAYDPLSIVQTTLPDGTEGLAYSVQLTAQGGAAQKSFALVAGSLPGGLSLSASGLISGMPGAPGATNPAQFTVRVTSGAQTDDQAFSLFVVGELRLVAGGLGDALRGTDYAAQINALGGRSAKSFSIISGALPPGLSLGAGTGTILGMATDLGSFSFTVLCTSDGQSDSKQYTISVYDPLVITTASLPEGLVGSAYSAGLTATGGASSRTWSAALPAGLTLNASTGAITGTPTAPSSGSVTFTVQSGSQSASRTLPLRIYGVLTIATTAPADAGRSMAYDFDLTATGGDGTYAWSIDSGALPAGLGLSGAGKISGTLSSSAATSQFVARVSSGAQNDTRPLSINVYDALLITTSALPAGYTETAYAAQLAASGGTGSGYQWALGAGAPGGLAIGQSTGALSGTPAAPGDSTFDVLVTTGTLTARKSFTVTVLPVLKIATTALPDAVKGEAYSTALAAGGGTGSYTWSMSGTLPAGISFASTGVLSGTPGAVSSATFTVQVQSGAQTASRQLTLSVWEKLQITTSALAEGVTGRAYSATLAASGGTGTTTWQLATGTLPQGLVLSSSGNLTGTPSASGSSTFTVRAQSGTQQATRALALEVRPLLTVATSALPSAVREVPYSQTLSAAGGTSERVWTVSQGTLPPGLALSGETISGTSTALGEYSFQVSVQSGSQNATRALSIAVYDAMVITTDSLPGAVRAQPYQSTLAAAGGSSTRSWSVVGGSLPPGLSLASSTGVLSGTPSSTGAFRFTVRVVSGALEGQKELTLAVAEPLAIATAGLPDADVGQPYDQGLEATGASAEDRRWSLAAGRLPPPLALSESGRIQGAPVLEGTYTFAARVESAGQAAQQSFTLRVANSHPALTVLTRFLEPALVGEPYQANLEADGGSAPYTWRIPTLPEGLKLDEATGDIYGRAAKTGSSTLNVTVTDAAGARAQSKLALVVASSAEVTVVQLPLPQAFMGESYAAMLRAVGGRPPYVWRAALGTLPDGLSLNGDGSLSGTPSGGTGVAEFTAQAQDADGKLGTGRFQIAVGDRARMEVVNASLPEGEVGKVYRADLLALGGTEPYVFSVGAGLPAGIVLDRRGLLTGTPTATGTFTFTLRADDSAGHYATRDLTIAVIAAPSRASPQGCGCGSGAEGGPLLWMALALATARVLRTRSCRRAPG